MTPSPSPNTRPRAWWVAGIFAVTAATVVKTFSPTIADPDLWGHVLYGQLARAVGWIPRFDPYSYLTAGKDWVNHEWLTEHVFAVVFGAAGPTGLVALKVGAAVAIVGLMLWHLSDRGMETLRAAILVLLLSIPLLLGLRTVRPHLFTYLFFAIVVVVLARADGTRGRELLLLPPVIAVWTNMHGGVLAGLGVIGLWTGVRVARAVVAHRRSRPDPGPPSTGAWIAALAASSAATLATPYGVELVEFLVTTATVPRPYITEWQPMELRSERGLLWIGGVLLTGWAILRCDDRPSPEALAVLGVLVLLPLTAVRHLPLTFIGIPALAAPAFAGRFGGGGRGSIADTKRAGWIGVGLCAVAVPVLLSADDDLECIEVNPDLQVVYPARAAAWLQDSGLEARLLTHFDYGQYLIWHLAPRMRVGMDGRRETAYPDSVYDAYIRFQHGRTEAWDDYPAMGSPDLALLPVGIPADNLLVLHPDWSVVYRDSLVRVHGRRGSPAAEAVTGTPVSDVPPDGRELCFP